MSEETNRENTPYEAATTLIEDHDGIRFESAKRFIAKMNRSDLELITDFCISMERVSKKPKHSAQYYEAVERLEVNKIRIEVAKTEAFLEDNPIINK